ncbi:hypothetical protein CATRI_01760 [Corynebacterium atrinae]|nr:hypothetical protein CATRI_01760 [Corynebacterium atrinae]
MRATLRRRLRQLVMALFIAALLGSTSLVAGAWLDDRAIDANPGRALATVTGVSTFRTTVDFRDSEGIYHSPPTGLLYPTGLGEGQRVWVNYSTADPDLVKVEGRRWTLSIIPALSLAVVSVLIAGLLWWAVSFFTRPRFTKS